MPQYKSYATVKDNPNRMSRKRARREVFQYNKYQAQKDMKKRREEEKAEKEKAKEATKD